MQATQVRAEPKVQARDLCRSFQNRLTGESIAVLDNINLSVTPGEFLTIVGPSGCGKTTLLRIFAGLLPPDSGNVLYDGAVVTGPSRKMGFVFQADNLMPWRNVTD